MKKLMILTKKFKAEVKEDQDLREFTEAGMLDAGKDLPPTTKEEYDYYMSLPQKNSKTLEYSLVPKGFIA